MLMPGLKINEVNLQILHGFRSLPPRLPRPYHTHVLLHDLLLLLLLQPLSLLNEIEGVLLLLLVEGQGLFIF
jgi:hypothetical protein